MNTPHRKILILGASAAIFMFGLTFALAPLYFVFCKRIGINITEKDNAFAPVSKRELNIQFVTIKQDHLPWDFYPKTTQIRIHPGALVKMTFFAKNNSTHTITVQAVPSFAPVYASRYFRKIECFCFTKQTLKAGESSDMALVFVVDNHVPADINTITLAYTLFDVTKKATA